MADSSNDSSTPTPDTSSAISEQPTLQSQSLFGSGEQENISTVTLPEGSMVSRRVNRSRRKGQLYKRQLEEANVTDDAVCSTPGGACNDFIKRKKIDDITASMEDNHKETDYYIENGLRKIYPYRYTYLCYCKERWKGMTLLDMLNNEFMASSSEFHTYQIQSGNVKVNGKVVQAGYKLKGRNELISNTLHRHELPVTAQPLKIIANTEQYVVVDKPSSIPVHPCGRYRHNSVIFILSRDYGFHNLRTIYRLDRLTSGLLIFGKTHASTNRIMNDIKERKVTKTYLCRVEGDFPEGVIECKEPLDKVHDKIGIWRVKANGKPSHTTFEKVNCNGSSSVVKCYPHTGRTHQIRVHLQYLGYPILNDPLYNDEVWGAGKGKNGDFGKTIDQLYEDLVAMHSRKLFESDLGVSNITSSSASKIQTSVANTQSVDSSVGLPAAYSDPRLITDENCDDCKKSYSDPNPHKMIMYLHALSYKGHDWEFSTEEPSWIKVY